MKIEALVTEIRRQWPACYTLYLNFSEHIFRVKTNSTALCEELKLYFSDFVVNESPHLLTITAHDAPVPSLPVEFIKKEPDPGKKRVKEEYADIEGGRIVRKRLTGMHFIFSRDDDKHVAIGPCLKNPNQVINFINNRFIALKLNEGGLLGHAAGVEFEGRGLALAGFSGAGKSTLALHLMSRGVTFISNDRLIVKENSSGGLSMFGVAKLPRVNPGTVLNNPNLNSVITAKQREGFKALEPNDLWTLEQKYDVIIDECFGRGLFKIESSMDSLVILNWKRNGEKTDAKEIDPEKRADLLPAFMKSEGLFFLTGTEQRDTSVPSYARLLGKCRVVEITGNVDFNKATEICMAMLNGQMPEMEE